MYYHPERRLVYLAHPHTASRSTSAALLAKGFQKQKGESHHAGLFENGIVTPENRDKWFVFTTVRNPYDWILAQVWKVELATHPNPDIAWDNLAMWKRNLKRCNWISENELFGLHKWDADRLIHLESLWWELKALVPKLTKRTIGKNPVRKGRPYWQFYSKEVRQWAEEQYGKEAEKLGYAF